MSMLNKCICLIRSLIIMIIALRRPSSRDIGFFKISIRLVLRGLSLFIFVGNGYVQGFLLLEHGLELWLKDSMEWSWSCNIDSMVILCLLEINPSLWPT